MSWLILLGAIVFEVAGTSTLKYTNGMTRIGPTVLMFVCYLISLFGLSKAVEAIPVGTAYAVWSGLGTLLVALMGAVLFGEQITLVRAISAMAVIAGVGGLYLTSASH